MPEHRPPAGPEMSDAELLQAVAKMIYDQPAPKNHGTDRLRHLQAQAMSRSIAARIITLVRSNT